VRNLRYGGPILVGINTSTALWSAFQRVAFVSGNRTPTPAEVTRAAASPFPACHGLYPEQMAAAISRLGYHADRFTPEDGTNLFRAKLIACLDSRLPIVLLISDAADRRDAHAVTVTGYSTATPSSVSVGQSKLNVQNASVSVLYVHDDNLGSHAHYELIDGTDTEICIRRGYSSPPPEHEWWPADTWKISEALIPKPLKIRLPIENLLLDALELAPMISSEILAGKATPAFSVFFDTGVEYRRRLIDGSWVPADLRAFQDTLSLPRHIGVVGVHVNEEPLLDVLLSGSEMPSDSVKADVLALVGWEVPQRSVVGQNLAIVAEGLDVPCLLAANTPT
jgi:hypothetical protein